MNITAESTQIKRQIDAVAIKIGATCSAETSKVLEDKLARLQTENNELQGQLKALFKLRPKQTSAPAAAAPVEGNVGEYSRAMATCKVLLESSLLNYVHDHNYYVCNTKNAKCKVELLNGTDALDHICSCPGVLSAWNFVSHPKLCTSALVNTMYSQMHDFIYNVNIPELLEPCEKRFLMRLFRARGYKVRVITPIGLIRDGTSDEWNMSTETSCKNLPAKEKTKREKRIREPDNSDAKSPKKR